MINSENGSIDIRQYGQNPDTPFTAYDNFGGFVATMPFLVEKVSAIALYFMKTYAAARRTSILGENEEYTQKVIKASDAQQSTDLAVKVASVLAEEDASDDDKEDNALDEIIKFLKHVSEDNHKKVTNYIEIVKDHGHADEFMPHEKVDETLNKIQSKFN